MKAGALHKILKGRAFSEIVYLALCTIRTKIFFNTCRLIRFPIQIRGRNKIIFSAGFTTGKYCRIEVFSSLNHVGKIKFGKNCQINDNVHIAACKSITIGDNVLIASRVFISDHNHGIYTGESPSIPSEPPEKRPLYSSPIIIEDNAWLGEGVAIMPGVKIGYGCVVGANSVVTKNLPEKTICVGVPAKVIKRYNETTRVWEKV